MVEERAAASITTVILLLILVSAAIVLTIYFSLAGRIPSSERGPKPGAIVIEAVDAGLGFIKLYVRSINLDAIVDIVYFYDEQGDLIAAYKLPRPFELHPGSLIIIDIPLLYLNAQLLENPIGGGIVERLASARYVGLGVVGGPVFRARLPVHSFLVALRRASMVEFGILVDPSLSYGDPREIVLTPPSYRYIVFNPVVGYWVMFYWSNNGLKRVEGALTLLEHPVLNLSSLSWSERYSLGPVIVFINPYRGSKRYTVTIVTIYGGGYSFTLEPLPDPQHIVLDVVVAWEDEWYPGTGQPLDNWADHVFRVTLYMNGTVRVEALRYSGTWLHMIFAHAPSVESLLRLTRLYDDNGYRLPESSGVAYVKIHTSRATGTPSAIWDPVAGVYITSWPIVVYRSV